MEHCGSHQHHCACIPGTPLWAGWQGAQEYPPLDTKGAHGICQLACACWPAAPAAPPAAEPAASPRPFPTCGPCPAPTQLIIVTVACTSSQIASQTGARVPLMFSCSLVRLSRGAHCLVKGTTSVPQNPNPSPIPLGRVVDELIMGALAVIAPHPTPPHPLPGHLQPRPGPAAWTSGAHSHKTNFKI